MISKEEIDKIMQTEGQVKGVVFQTDREYVKNHFGYEKLKLVEQKLADWGHPLVYDKIQALEWLPAGMRALSLLAVKEALELKDEDIRNMGAQAPKFSFIIRTLLGFFMSIEKIVKTSPEVWQRHWTAGQIVPEQINEKSITLRIENLNLHPLFCKYEEGYFERIMQFVKPESKVREVKCAFKGDPYHEYEVSWK
ncbi:hypothetical protein HZC35_04055 [Candidatus Saganbacteria bacterium]|nr:hypothetical protein [Candidatus Saganbacteria bacterium]